MYTHIHTRTHTCTHTYTHTHIHTCTHTHTHTRTYARTHTQTHTHTRSLVSGTVFTCLTAGPLSSLFPDPDRPPFSPFSALPPRPFALAPPPPPDLALRRSSRPERESPPPPRPSLRGSAKKTASHAGLSKQTQHQLDRLDSCGKRVLHIWSPFSFCGLGCKSFPSSDKQCFSKSKQRDSP